MPAVKIGGHVSSFLRESKDGRSIWGIGRGFREERGIETHTRCPSAKVADKLATPAVTHVDEPAKISPLEAQSIAQHQWATLVEHRVHHAASAATAASRQPDHIVMLTFNRHPEELERALLLSGPARTARAMGIDVKPGWANGAKVFVDDVGPERFDVELGPMNVVLHEADEGAVFEALQALPFNVKRLKSGSGRAFVPNDFSMIDVSSDEAPEEGVEALSAHALEVKVKYGFIHVGARVASRSQGARSVHTV